MLFNVPSARAHREIGGDAQHAVAVKALLADDVPHAWHGAVDGLEIQRQPLGHRKANLGFQVGFVGGDAAGKFCGLAFLHPHSQWHVGVAPHHPRGVGNVDHEAPKAQGLGFLEYRLQAGVQGGHVGFPPGIGMKLTAREQQDRDGQEGCNRAQQNGCFHGLVSHFACCAMRTML
jgi:hypothetical protein